MLFPALLLALLTDDSGQGQSSIRELRGRMGLRGRPQTTPSFLM